MNANQNSYFMSYGDFRMQDWLLKAELSPGAKLTYSVLACCAGGKDHAWPSQEFLAEKVSASVRSVQRYLRELIEYGLIEKFRQQIKGQMRCVYRFLLHSMIGLSGKSERHDNLSPYPAAPQKNLPVDTTICQKQYDNLSHSLNKEETIKGKEILPPTPQLDIHSEPSPVLTLHSSGKECDFLSGVKEEDPRWKQAKEYLSAELSEADLKTWIYPLIFEAADHEAALCCPNSFFQSWVQKNFTVALNLALKEAGINSWILKLQTETQIAENQARLATQAIEIAAQIKPTPVQEDLETLTLEDQFACLLEAYPVKKEEDDAKRIFLRQKRRGLLPPLKELIQSIKDHKNHDRWWREKMPPLLSTWLSKNKWKDKPYE